MPRGEVQEPRLGVALDAARPGREPDGRGRGAHGEHAAREDEAEGRRARGARGPGGGGGPRGRGEARECVCRRHGVVQGDFLLDVDVGGFDA